MYFGQLNNGNDNVNITNEPCSNKKNQRCIWSGGCCFACIETKELVYCTNSGNYVKNKTAMRYSTL